MKIALSFLLISTALFAQKSSEYYIKAYHNRYLETKNLFDENYTFKNDSNKNPSSYITTSIDITYRPSPKWQSLISISFIDVRLEQNGSSDLSRSGITDIWLEEHYYFSQYPKKMYVGFGIKIPSGYDEKKNPWLANGAYEARFRFVNKRIISKNFDWEADLSFDYSLNSSERIKSSGYALPYFLSASYYKKQLTYLATLSGAFKSYQYKSGNDFGDSYRQFILNLGASVKYKLTAVWELELAYQRSLFGFQDKVSNTIGFGLSFGIRD